MANFFNKANNASMSQREILEAKYKSSVSNLLLVIIMSAVNMVLLLANSNTYFLFSAFIPYVMVDYGMYICGMYPAEYYYDVQDMVFADKSVFALVVIIAVVIVLLYLLCWFFAKKKKVGWLVFALVLFAIDTLSMFALTGFSTDSIIDIVFHFWVVFYLINGIVTYSKLKKLPIEEMSFVAEGEVEETVVPYQESSILRMADNDVKFRVLVEAEAEGHHIVFRRVKKVNELVVDGRVYDEYEALVEFQHKLSAYVGGHKIEAEYDGVSSSLIYVDDKVVAKKLRIY